MENHHLMTGQTVKFDFIPAVRLLYGQFDALRFQSDPADCFGNLTEAVILSTGFNSSITSIVVALADVSAGHFHLAAAVDRIHVKRCRT